MNTTISSGRRFYIGLMKGLMILSAALTCGLALFLIGFVLYKGVPNLTWELVSSKPSYLTDTIGILPDILNTLYILIAALLVVLPFGVGAAIYLTEYARNRKLVAVIEYAAETLSGIPSIIFGLVGMLLFANTFGSCLLAGALTLAVMNLPTVIRSTQESLRAVPRSCREGALGLGSGRWHMVRTLVLPASAGGIATGCMLAVGRVAGESAVLLYTAGLSTAMQDFTSLQGMAGASGATLTTVLYLYAKERADFAAAFSVATVLLALQLAIHLGTALAGRRRRR